MAVDVNLEILEFILAHYAIFPASGRPGWVVNDGDDEQLYDTLEEILTVILENYPDFTPLPPSKKSKVIDMNIFRNCVKE